ncbi:MAG: DUF4386 domain-containing protein [Clostridiales bacterium]|nr:DUF4386 domain-containing protein [Clostridiales bacterium]
MTTNNKKLFLLLGTTLFTQATTSLVGGLIGFGPRFDTSNTASALNSIASNIGGVYIGIFLQLVTALVIVALAAAFYQAGKGINKTVAIIAFGFYITETVVHIVTQIVTFALSATAAQFAAGGDASLLTIGEILLRTREFCGAITMMPFGLGAILFYYLITKSKVLPKWLGGYGIITVSFILVGWSLQAFGVPFPFALYVPYVPFEWVAGVYIFIKGTIIEKGTN